jgi:predicted dehydrogenase
MAAHLPWITELGERYLLAAVVDPDDHARRHAARRHRALAAYADHREMLAEQDLDAVLIASPNATHADIACDAIAAGVNVLVEKPICLTVEDVDRVIAARDRAGVVVQVGYMKRFDPAYEALLSDLPHGADELLHLSSTTYDPGLEAWFGAAGSRAAAPDVLSDVFLGALIHDVNLAAGVLERIGAAGSLRVVHAFAREDGRAAGATVVVDDRTTWTGAWLRIDGLGDFRQDLEVFTVDGVRRLSFPAPYLPMTPTTYERSSARNGANERVVLREWSASYRRQLVHFHDCVTTGATCRTPPEQAREDIRLLIDAHAAARPAAVA